MNDAINHTACETLFTQARTHNGWLDKPVTMRSCRPSGT